jgi:zinc transport system ATP-binding protein
MKLVSCKNISMDYEGRLAVNNVSFDLEQGDYLCIVGENGSGKSTFIKGLLGLMQPTNGAFTFGCIAQTDIGYLPQQTIVQKDFPANVFEVVISGCLNRKGLRPFYSKKEKERANENIKLLGLEELKGKSYRDLSGGQQQRVLLARALCATERLILLDEPVTGLDPIMTCEMYALIKKLNSEQNITVIMVSHDIKSAVTFGNKILHMKTSPLFFGLTADYLSTDLCKRMMGAAVHD